MQLPHLRMTPKLCDRACALYMPSMWIYGCTLMHTSTHTHTHAWFNCAPHLFFFYSCLCDDGWIGNDCSVPVEPCPAPHIESVVPGTGAEITNGVTISITGDCLMTAAYMCVFETEAPPMRVEELAIAVGNRGLECTVPLQLSLSLYADLDSCGIAPILPVHFLLHPVEASSGQWVNTSYSLRHCGSDADCANGGVCWSTGLCRCGFDWCGSLCEAPANVTGLCHATPLAIQDYNVVSLGNFTAIGGSSIDGRVLVFGDMRISNYSISHQLELPSTTQVSVFFLWDVVTSRFPLFLCGGVVRSTGRP